MTVTTAKTQELIQSQIQKILTIPLQQESTFLSSGVKIVDSAAPVRFPRLEAWASEPGYVAEGADIPMEDVAFSEVTAMPSTMQAFKRVVPVSDEALRVTSIDLSSTIQSALTRSFSLRVDRALFGSGGDSVSTIKGICAQPGTTQHAVNGPLTVDTVRAAWATLLKKHVNVSALRLFVTPGDLADLLGEKDGDGRPLIQPDVTREAAWRLFGVPLVVTDQIPDTSGATPTGRAILADMSKVAVVRDIQSVQILREALALKGQVGLKAQARFDLALLAPEAVCILTGIAR